MCQEVPAITIVASAATIQLHHTPSMLHDTNLLDALLSSLDECLLEKKVG
jgi:hypothetical protein